MKSDQELTEKQIQEIENARNHPVVFDDDAPELSEEQYAEMAAIARERRIAK